MLPNYEFLEAIKRGTDREVLTALDNGAKLNARDLKGRSALLLCDLYERNDIARMLIKRGADLHEQIGPNADTLLHQAIRHGNLAFAGLLMDRGISPNICNRLGETPLHLSASRDFEYFTQTLLGMGAEASYQDAKCDTPLHIAARKGSIGAMTRLINAGASLTLENTRKHTPLHEAVLSGNLEAVNLLLHRGHYLYAELPNILASAKQVALVHGHCTLALAMDSPEHSLDHSFVRCQQEDERSRLGISER